MTLAWWALAAFDVLLIRWIWKKVKAADDRIDATYAKRDELIHDLVRAPKTDTALSKKATELGFQDSDDDYAFLLDEPTPTRPAA